MAYVNRGITCFLHGTQRNSLYQILFFLVLDIIQQAVDGFGNF